MDILKRTKRFGVGVFAGLVVLSGVGMAQEGSYEHGFADGAKVRVYDRRPISEEDGKKEVFAKDALSAAVSAYRILTDLQGFNAPGYSFAFPDKRYAYDPDGTIDIFIGDREGFVTPYPGFSRLSFRDAPCFDTVKTGETAFQAVILLPSDYREFIKGWERLNPSPAGLGSRHVEVDLKGTLMHEMLHAVLFYYNRNLDEKLNEKRAGKRDWYVEGLARYFEVFAGAKHDFFSQGFREVLTDRIRFSRGGSNFFMRYPDQAFMSLRYENALFWRFVHHRYGMETIEKMSRCFRRRAGGDVEKVFPKAAGVKWEELLKQFARAVILRDFGLHDEALYLKEAARTSLAYRGGVLYLKHGGGDEALAGNTCGTDWVGEWDGAAVRLGSAPVAGDPTEEADVSGWATDFCEIEVGPAVSVLPRVEVLHLEGGKPLAVQVILFSKGGSWMVKEMGKIPSGKTSGLDLEGWVKGEGLEAKDIRKVCLLITNGDREKTARYAVRARGAA